MGIPAQETARRSNGVEPVLQVNLVVLDVCHASLILGRFLGKPRTCLLLSWNFTNIQSKKDGTVAGEGITCMERGAFHN